MNSEHSTNDGRNLSGRGGGFPHRSRDLWVILFSIAMAYFEAAVVVYLRTIAYPEGFSFPLAPIPGNITIAEIGREAASLIMILAVAVIAGRYRKQSFAYFLIIFGIWDIFYYVFLLVLQGWPPSLFTWDILFLIPVVWSGPVITPALVAVAMIVTGRALLRQDSGAESSGVGGPGRGHVAGPGDNGGGAPPGRGGDSAQRDGAKVSVTPGRPIMTRREWWPLLTGGVIVFVSFIWDYVRFVWEEEEGSFVSSAWDASTRYTPGRFPWLVYVVGLGLMVFAAVRVARSRSGTTGRPRNG